MWKYCVPDYKLNLKPFGCLRRFKCKINLEPNLGRWFLFPPHSPLISVTQCKKILAKVNFGNNYFFPKCQFSFLVFFARKSWNACLSDQKCSVIFFKMSNQFFFCRPMSSSLIAYRHQTVNNISGDVPCPSKNRAISISLQHWSSWRWPEHDRP